MGGGVYSGCIVYAVAASSSDVVSFCRGVTPNRLYSRVFRLCCVRLFVFQNSAAPSSSSTSTVLRLLFGRPPSPANLSKLNINFIVGGAIFECTRQEE